MDILRKDREQDVSSAPSMSGGQREERVTTTLGEDTEFDGTLKFTNTLRLEGRFKGKMESEGQLIVAKTGLVQAEIKVGSATIDGKIEGNISAKDLVELRSTAEIMGDIKASRLKIDDGVVFVGHADVTPSAKRASSGSGGGGRPESQGSSQGGSQGDQQKGDQQKDHQQQQGQQQQHQQKKS